MYPIDITQLVRRGTLGSRAGDPTLPDSPRRLFRLTKALRRSHRPGQSTVCEARGRATQQARGA